jgi:hypothetical protein
MQKGTVIGNVGVLDLRKAGESPFPEIAAIGNVGTVLYSRETAGLVTRLNIGNLAETLEISPEVQVLTDSVVFHHGYFEGQQAPLDLFVAGHVLIEPDVATEEIEQGLGELSVAGPLICPEHLIGAVQAKARHVGGPTMAYPPAGHVTIGKLVLDEAVLQSLDDDSHLVVVGVLRLPDVLPNDLLKQKIASLRVAGGIRCHEENLRVVMDRLVDKTVKVKTIPAGFVLVERSLLLDGIMLESLPSKKLYCTSQVQIAADVDPASLDESLEKIVSTNMIVCPMALKSVLARKCSLLDTRVVFYEGELWLIDGADTLSPSRFDYLEGQATLVVLGSLKIAPEVDPQVLADRLGKVHNLGVVHCTPQQRGAIQARLGLSDGVLRDSTETEEQEEKSRIAIGNMSYLAL